MSAIVQIMDQFINELQGIRESLAVLSAKVNALEQPPTAISMDTEKQLNQILQRLSTEATGTPTQLKMFEQGPEYLAVKEIPWLKEFFPVRQRPIIRRTIGRALTEMSRGLGYDRLIPLLEGQSTRYHPEVIAKFKERVANDRYYLLRSRV